MWSLYLCYSSCVMFFFFQAEDGIRDSSVTGVQTCALPICFFRRLPVEFTQEEMPWFRCVARASYAGDSPLSCLSIDSNGRLRRGGSLEGIFSSFPARTPGKKHLPFQPARDPGPPHVRFTFPYR